MWDSLGNPSPGRNREQCCNASCGEQEPVCPVALRNQLSHLEKGTRRTDHTPQLLDRVPQCSSSACG